MASTGISALESGEFVRIRYTSVEDDFTGESWTLNLPRDVARELLFELAGVFDAWIDEGGDDE